MNYITFIIGFLFISNIGFSMTIDQTANPTDMYTNIPTDTITYMTSDVPTPPKIPHNLCNCHTNVPNLVSEIKYISYSHVCYGCNYTNIYPRGYSHISVNYNYGHPVGQEISQNGNIIGRCPVSKSCNKRFSINPNYPVVSKVFRLKESNHHYIFYLTQGYHIVNFNYYNNSYINKKMCLNAPILNNMNQNLFSHCLYTYYISVGKNVLINMQFNHNVTVNIYENNNILYSKTGNYFYRIINTNFSNIKMTVKNMNYTTNTVALVFSLTTINNDLLESKLSDLEDSSGELVNSFESISSSQNNYSNVKVIALVSIVFGVLSISTIILGIIFILRYTYISNGVNQEFNHKLSHVLLEEIPTVKS